MDLFSLGKVKASETLQSHLNSSSLFPLTFASLQNEEVHHVTCMLPPSYKLVRPTASGSHQLWEERNMHPVMGVFSPTKLTNPNQKLPLLVYFHGGVCSPFTSKYYKLHGAGSPPVIISPVFSCFYTNERHVASNKS